MRTLGLRSRCDAAIRSWQRSRRRLRWWGEVVASPAVTISSGSRSRQARRTLLAAAAALFVATLGLSAALETVRPQWRDPEFGHRLMALRQLQQHTAPGRPLVVILGTSRAQNGLWPQAMGLRDREGAPLVFNFGQTGSPPVKVWLTWRRLVDAGTAPRAVIIEVLPVWLSFEASPEEFFVQQAERLSWRDMRQIEEMAGPAESLRRSWLRQRLMPWHSQRAVLMSHWLPRWLSWSERVDPFWTGMEPDGFMPFVYGELSPELRRRATAHAWEEHHKAFAGFAVAPQTRRWLAAIVAECRERQVAVAWVEPPVAPLFRSWFSRGVWEAGEQALAQLAAELEVPLFPPLTELDDTAFADGHHMLRPSAAHYSRWLAEHYLLPWLVREGVIPSDYRRYLQSDINE